MEVRVSGPGSGRESAVRALATAGIEVRSIGTSRRFRTTAAVRRRGAESRVFGFSCQWLVQIAS